MTARKINIRGKETRVVEDSIVDKRSMTTDALDTLGSIITEDEGRDAIHLAVEPCEADCILVPSQNVGLVSPQLASGLPRYEKVGIVDPFLLDRVKKGQWFWLVVYPRKITSLRHVWEHPAFGGEEEVRQRAATSKSKAWVNQYALSVGLDFNELITAANDWVDSGHYYNRGELLDGVYLDEGFWVHYTIITGKKVGEPENFFSCSC